MLSKIRQIVKSLSKNSDNKIEQSGSNNLAVQGLTDSTLTIINISDPHYEIWKQQLETERKYCSRLNEDEIEERIRISRNISILELQISEYEKQVLILAEEINRKNNFKSYRLNKAKELIEKGQIGEAREFYRSKVNEIQEDENEISNKRRELAEEYLILAILTQTDYYNPHLFEESLKYFKKSLEINENQDNLISFAYFLQKHKRILDSKRYYERVLERFENSLNSAEKGVVYNNLGNAFAASYEFDKAISHLKYALEIRKKLAKQNPFTYSTDVASTIENLAHIFTLKSEVEKAEKEYNEALKIRQLLFKNGDDYQKFHIADILMSLGVLNSNVAQEKNDNKELIKATDYFLQALETYETLTEDKNFISLHVAICLENLGLVYQRRKDLKNALEKSEKANALFQIIVKADPAYLTHYAQSLCLLGGIKSNLQNKAAIEDFQQALRILRNLEIESPKAFLPDISIILNNIAIYYLKTCPKRIKSIEYAVESIVIIAPFLNSMPRLERYYNSSIRTLITWNLSKDEINLLIEKRTKEQYVFNLKSF